MNYEKKESNDTKGLCFGFRLGEIDKMNNFKFFVFQVLLTFLGIATDLLFREFIYIQFNNRIIPALMETPITMVLIYFTFKLYSSLKTTKLRYKILIHIFAFIVGAIFVGLTFRSFILLK